MHQESDPKLNLQIPKKGTTGVLLGGTTGGATKGI